MSSAVHILRSVITVIQFPDPRVWSILSHCWTSSVNDVRFWQQWRATMNIEQPCKIIRTFLRFFLKIQKNMTFTFFWVAAHVFTRTWLRYVRVFAVAIPSVCRLSVCNVGAPYSGLKLSAKFHHRCVRWPSSDLRAKFYGDSPRGTPPSGALNARGVSK